ncbi:hypothetical protein MMC13_003368 [Lambiella insularis]|nr:hypothetical protein [Lambiella insularis]
MEGCLLWLLLRKPREDALLPDQVRNEVAWLEYIRRNLPKLAVPNVYAHRFNGTSAHGVFIAEFIEGDRLSEVWSTYDEPTKMHMARQIAGTIVELGDTNFGDIGGLMLDEELGPTVEGMKSLKGRDRFRSSKIYNIGPYPSVKEYVLACYDKEIYCYTHASDDDVGDDLFEDVSRSDFIKQLRSERDAIELDPFAFLPEEPFVLVHGDLHGRNIVVKDGRIQAILDWEFAGAFPLSELLGGMGVDVLGAENEDIAEECNVWSEKIASLAREIGKERA